MKFSAVEIPAVGNRVYTNDVRLRGRRGYSEIENHRVKSSTREGGFCLCRRGFQPPGFLGFNRRVFGGWAIGFFVGGRSNLREMCDLVFVLIGAIGFLGLLGDRVFGGWAIGL